MKGEKDAAIAGSVAVNGEPAAGCGTAGIATAKGEAAGVEGGTTTGTEVSVGAAKGDEGGNAVAEVVWPKAEAWPVGCAAGADEGMAAAKGLMGNADAAGLLPSGRPKGEGRYAGAEAAGRMPAIREDRRFTGSGTVRGSWGDIGP